VHHAQALTFDRAAVDAWLRQSSGTDGLTRAASLGIDEELFGAGIDGFLSTVDAVLTASPDGLHRRADITGVQLWLVPARDNLDQRAQIIVALANGVRLASPRQDIKDFADRQQRGIAAALSALAHVANQACLLVETYQAADTGYPGGKTGVAMTTTDPTATAASRPDAFTEQQVADALNEAADDILDAVEAGDEGLRDGLNLLVNATLAYLTGQAQDLSEVVEQKYGDDLDTVLRWIEEAA